LRHTDSDQPKKNFANFVTYTSYFLIISPLKKSLVSDQTIPDFIFGPMNLENLALP